jgi:short-subunit dehydrogenase involved in D-alanine esterification of teichoic acids
MKTSGHKILITGGGSGIGRALAEKFYQAGNQVIIVGRDGAKLEETAVIMPGTTWRVADVTNAAHRAQLVAEFPNISVLVNNAGIQRNGDFVSMSIADIESEIDIDFRAPALLCHAFLPHLLKQQEAAIVNISSALALVPKPIAPIYCAAKAALHSFSQSLRQQLESTGVNVFDVLPALVDTPMTAQRFSSKLSPAKLADEFWRGYQSNRFEMYIGKTRMLKAINRIAPAVAERIVRAGQ